MHTHKSKRQLTIYIHMQMLRRRESRASTGRPVTHAVINNSKVKCQATYLSAMVTWKIFELYMSRNSMSINHRRSNLTKHKNTMNNKVTVSYNHMHMPLYSFFICCDQTNYVSPRDSYIPLCGCLASTVWKFDPKVSCE